jgi:hypothetical protein
VHCFYGEVGFVRETSMAPTLRVIDRAESGEVIDTGESVEPLDGLPFPPNLLEEARRISLEIPFPYMRIDFLRDGDGFAFCEFTPHPGSVTRYRRLDGELGDMFLKAEARIVMDLLGGKGFETFKRHVMGV